MVLPFSWLSFKRIRIGLASISQTEKAFMLSTGRFNLDQPLKCQIPVHGSPHPDSFCPVWESSHGSFYNLSRILLSPQQHDGVNQLLATSLISQPQNVNSDVTVFQAVIGEYLADPRSLLEWIGPEVRVPGPCHRRETGRSKCPCPFELFISV